jgi:ANTAR domain
MISMPTRWSWLTSPLRQSSCCRRTRRPESWPPSWRRGADFHYVVHQAPGMVAAQLDVSVGQALIRLRAYAFGNDRPLAEVAEDVVARKLRFDA